MHRFLSRICTPYLLTVALGVGAVATTSPACTSQIHIATVADTGLVDALHQAKIAEAQAYNQHLYGATQHRENLQILIKLDTDALALTDALIAWKQAGASPTTLPTIVTASRQIVQQLLTDLSNQPATSPLIRALRGILVFLQ